MAESEQTSTATRHGNQPTKALGQLGYPSCGPRLGVECADSKFPLLPQPAQNKTFKMGILRSLFLYDNEKFLYIIIQSDDEIRVQVTGTASPDLHM
jgi:hypothetical protein